MANVRWKCDNCESVVLAPTRPRKNDVRRYCLPCSSKTGKLVERVSPTLEKRKERVKQTKRTQQQKKRETVAKRNEKLKPLHDLQNDVQKFGAYRMPIKQEAKRIWNLFAPYHNGAKMPKIQIDVRGVEFDVEANKVWRRANGRAGYADYRLNQITLKVREDWGTLAHELCHMAVGSRQTNGRYQSHDEVFYRALKDVYERRWKVRINWSKVTRFGYDVDHIMEAQVVHIWQTAWEKEGK